LPNIAISAEDVDLFDDEPQSYIKMDLEESDLETRRRLCMKFVQALSRRFTEVGSLLQGLSNTLNTEYMSDKNANW
jgi:hypothetical protein